MTTPQTGPDTANRQAALWAVSLASLGVFLVSWALCWMHAFIINDDLPNACGDLRRQSFPPEMACVAADGSLTGANAGWIEAVFFASLVVFVLLTSMLLALEVVRRK
jgi:hypothetical protein